MTCRTASGFNFSSYSPPKTMPWPEEKIPQKESKKHEMATQANN
jgi:hypothetical protein